MATTVREQLLLKESMLQWSVRYRYARSAARSVEGGTYLVKPATTSVKEATLSEANYTPKLTYVRRFDAPCINNETCLRGWKDLRVKIPDVLLPRGGGVYETEAQMHKIFNKPLEEFIKVDWGYHFPYDAQLMVVDEQPVNTGREAVSDVMLKIS